MSAALVSSAPSALPVSFVSSMLGFTGFTDFVLEPLDETGLLYSLNSTDPAGPHLFLLDPKPFFPDYKPAVDASVPAKLGAVLPRVLVIVTAGADASQHTANLLAPVLVNEVSGSALQVVLDDDSWPLRATFG